jgi:adenylate cyclase
MGSEKLRRELTAILSADVEGDSPLLGGDKEGTLRTLNVYKELIGGLLQRYRGRAAGPAGNRVLAEFASTVDAVHCAIAIQKELKSRNTGLPENRRMEFRIGINLGEVIGEGKDIYGGGVDIAGHISSLAEPGSICITGAAYDHIQNKLPLVYEYLGEKDLKDIAGPVPVYRIRMEAKASISRVSKWKEAGLKYWRQTPTVLKALGTLVITLNAGWQLYSRVLSPADVAPPQKVLSSSSEKSSTAPKSDVNSKEKMAFPLPDKPSIAVLPFANMSDDKEQEYFSDGMTEDLITDLSKISGLFVIARNSTFTYKGKPVKVKQVAAELGVRYVLEGSVRRAGEQVRINAQLIEATTGHHLWAERYDGNMRDVFALQDKICQKIVSALAVKLTGSEKELAAQKGTRNVPAYDAFLRGYGHYLRFTPEDSAKAVTSLKKAIELDPNYERAYAALSAVYYDATMNSGVRKGLGVPWHEALARSIQYLQRAPKDPLTHGVKSRMHVFRRQHQEAISEMEQALALDPNDPACHLHMGNALTMAGRPKEAAEFLKRGMRLDPHSPSRYLANLGMASFCMGELEEAMALFEKAMRLNPENAPSWARWLASFYGLLGRDQEARAALEMNKKVWGDRPFSLRIFMYYRPFKDRAVADRYAEGLLKAGISGKLNDYLPAFKENQLNGEEIRRLLFDSTITGFDWNWLTEIRQQWWMDNKKNGEFTWRGPAPIFSDTGKNRIEGDAFCSQYQKSFGGVEFCGTVFRYPAGTPEGKDQYFWCSDFGFSTFSLVK